jgi:hypothetical protein
VETAKPTMKASVGWKEGA